MIEYIIIVALTGIITGISMIIIVSADGCLEKVLAFVLGFLTHLVLTFLLTALAYWVIEQIIGVVCK